MENPLNITALNDFVFCPVSIYFHLLYDGVDKILYQGINQINGTYAHKSIDSNSYTGPASIKSMGVYCEQYNLIGKIDLYDKSKKILIERKKKVRKIYDGYVFQIYAQYFAMKEMGYDVKKLLIYSMDDNKKYYISLPENNPRMLERFENLIKEINSFDINGFIQKNHDKCSKCIYSLYCDRGV